MKILVVSLLRIGDFLLSLPTVNGLKSQSGVTKVDLLTFKPTAQLRDMVHADHWWTLNRDDLQAGLGRAEIPMLTSYSVLKETLDRINVENYDLIVNLTQTEFSAWITGYLQARAKEGMVFGARGEVEFHSPWFRYLNAREQSADIFHYSDIFYYGAGLDGAERDWTLRETPQGELEAGPFAGRKTIAIQALTSDEKKNWSRWLEVMTILAEKRPDHQFVLLGAPNERERIDALVQGAVSRKLNARAAIVSLAGAFSILKHSELLITGDTSIKHLANSAGIPVLELALGSSDYRRTGVYQPDSAILNPSVACAPCPHSSPCSRKSHECAEMLSPGLVASAAEALLEKNWSRLSALAEQPTSKTQILRTIESSNGFWLPRPLNQARGEQILQTLIERSSWKFLLSGEHKKLLAEYGSESLNLKAELKNLFSESERPRLNAHLDFLESENEKISRHLENQLALARSKSPEAGGEVVSIVDRRRQTMRLESSADHARIQMKMIKTLKSQLMETL